MTVDDWWLALLQECEDDGRRGAELGVYDPPNIVCEECPDPQYEAENERYKKGFRDRRRELGDRFSWG